MKKENKVAGLDYVTGAYAAGKKKRRKSSLTTWILVGVMVLGLGIMAYPTFSNWWNSFHASRAIASYSSTVENMDKEKLDAMIEAAHEYNRKLAEKENPFAMTDEDREEYNSLLDLSGTGIIGYITIRSINVYIPVYHGTEESVLQIAIGHLDWSSLPVGGEGTHALLSGHRGLPSAKLFSDLDQVREGDIFTVTVLNQMISYEVDQIRIVEPTDVSDLVIEEGQDYCTLITCTPYSINSHRMLVRGHRVENDRVVELRISADAMQIDPIYVAPAIAIPVLVLLVIWLFIMTSGRSKRRREQRKRAAIGNIVPAKALDKKPSPDRKSSGRKPARDQKRDAGRKAPAKDTRAKKPAPRGKKAPARKSAPKKESFWSSLWVQPGQQSAAKKRKSAGHSGKRREEPVNEEWRRTRPARFAEPERDEPERLETERLLEVDPIRRKKSQSREIKF